MAGVAFTIDLEPPKARRRSVTVDPENALPSRAMASKTGVAATEGATPPASCCLRLERFAPATVLEFGDVQQGTERTGLVTIVNPTSTTKTVHVDSASLENGFTLPTLYSGFITTLAPHADTSFPVLWKPEVLGNVRQAIKFTVGVAGGAATATSGTESTRIQKVSLTMFGTCIAAPSQVDTKPGRKVGLSERTASINISAADAVSTTATVKKAPASIPSVKPTPAKAPRRHEVPDIPVQLFVSAPKRHAVEAEPEGPLVATEVVKDASMAMTFVQTAKKPSGGPPAAFLERLQAYQTKAAARSIADATASSTAEAVPVGKQASNPARDRLVKKGRVSNPSRGGKGVPSAAAEGTPAAMLPTSETSNAPPSEAAVAGESPSGTAACFTIAFSPVGQARLRRAIKHKFALKEAVKAARPSLAPSIAKTLLARQLARQDELTMAPAEAASTTALVRSAGVSQSTTRRPKPSATAAKQPTRPRQVLSNLMKLDVVADVERAKEGELLTVWLNSVLSADAEAAAAQAPNTLVLARREARIKLAAFKLFHGHTMEAIRAEMEREIASGKLSARPDREVHADQGLRSKLTALLLSYNPVWLKLGLETVFGEAVGDGDRAVAPAAKSQPAAGAMDASRRAASAAPMNRHARPVVAIAVKPRSFLRRAASVVPLKQYQQMAVQRERQQKERRRAQAAPPSAAPAATLPAVASTVLGPVAAPTAAGAGDVKKAASPAEALVGALKRFITKKLLIDKQVADKYARSRRGVFDKEHALEQQRALLSRFLSLVLFLDMARNADILEGTQPCLFQPDSTIKSSKEVLLAFGKEVLRGEGDFMRRLSSLGFTLSYTQSKLEELSWKIANIAVDLRDGTRFVRLAECLAHLPALSLCKTHLRIPAPTRTNKVYNLTFAFEQFTRLFGMHFEGMESKHASPAAGEPVEHSSSVMPQLSLADMFKAAQRTKRVPSIMSGRKSFIGRKSIFQKKATGAGKGDASRAQKAAALRVLPKDIADGHQEKTYALLWALAKDVFIRSHVKSEVILGEIQRLCTVHASAAALLSVTGGIPNDSANIEELLLKWTQAVCAIYGVRVYDLTHSFADGRALAYFISHYHPGFLQRGAIHTRTATPLLHSSSPLVTPKGGKQVVFKLSVTKKLLEAALASERANWKMLSTVISSIQPVKFGELSFNTVAVPDASCMYLLVATVGSVLLDVSADLKASLVLQRWWRRVLSLRWVARRAVLARVAKCFHVSKLQCWYRRLLPSAPERWRRRAAVKIQALVRGIAGRRRAVLARLAKEAVKAFKRRKFQRRLAEQRDKRATAATFIQAHVRGFLVRSAMRAKVGAATLVQAAWRGYRARIAGVARGFAPYTFYDLRGAIVCIQAAFRRRMQVRWYASLRRGVIAIQQRYRALPSHRLLDASVDASFCSLASMSTAATTPFKPAAMAPTRSPSEVAYAASLIQAAWRRFRAFHAYAALRFAVCSIQQTYRLRRDRVLQQSARVQKAACVLTQFMRMACSRLDFLHARGAAMAIQRAWRCSSFITSVEIMIGAVRTLREFVLIVKHRLAFKKAVAARRALQAAASTVVVPVVLASVTTDDDDTLARVRNAMERARDELAAERCAVAAATAEVVASDARKVAGCRLATWARRCLDNFSLKAHLAELLAANKVYRFMRCAADRMRFLVQRGAAMTIQQVARGFLARRHFLRLRAGTVVAQALWRRRAAQRVFSRMRHAAKCLQRCYRSRLARIDFLLMKFACVTIQRGYRQILARRAKATALLAATAAAAAEARAANVLAAKQSHAAVTMQRLVRGWLARQQYQGMCEERDAAAACIQAWWRCMRMDQTRADRTAAGIAAVVRLQSLYRGAKVRAARPKAVDIAARRIAIAMKNRERGLSLTLGDRTTAALRTIATSRSLAKVLEACAELEVATRLSPTCCAACVAVNAAPAMFALIRSCNRTAPHVQLVRKALGVLRNVAAIPKFVGRVAASAEAVIVLIDALQMYRDTLPVVRPCLDLLQTLTTRSRTFGDALASNVAMVRRLHVLRDYYSRRIALESPAAAAGKDRFSVEGTLREYDALLAGLEAAATASATALVAGGTRARTPQRPLLAGTPSRPATAHRGQLSATKAGDSKPSARKASPGMTRIAVADRATIRPEAKTIRVNRALMFEAGGHAAKK